MCAAGDDDVFFSRLVEEAGYQIAVCRKGFAADRAGAADSRLRLGVAVGAAGNSHSLVGNIHGMVYGGGKIVAFCQGGIADRAAYEFNLSVLALLGTHLLAGIFLQSLQSAPTQEEGKAEKNQHQGDGKGYAGKSIHKESVA